jgi:hypothetical protein
MVALVLGLLVVLGASQLFLSSSQSFRSIESINKRQEVISYISSVLGYEIRKADGNFGPIDADSADGIGTSSERLRIYFTGDDYKPYCSAGTVKMEQIEYYLVDSVLELSASCDSVIEDPINIISGISEIRFEAEKVNAENVYVDVIITLEPTGSPPTSDVVSMRFSRHSSEIFL